MMRLANWARLEGDVDPWPGEDELHHSYEEHLRQAQIRGEIREDISPFHISTIIFGAMHVWWEYHSHLISHALESGDGEDADEQYARQLLNLVMRGLMPDCSEVKRTEKTGGKK
jgi:TetR/AcrR family transcriptional regulator